MAIDLIKFWMGRDKLYHPAEDIVTNALSTVQKTNALLAVYKNATGREVNTVNSGWRPPAVNAKTAGAAKKSHHMTGCAVDLGDLDEALDVWLESKEGQLALAACGLWHEGRAYTPKWCHLQTKPYGSYAPGKSRSFNI
jgi:hypothetical protein